jgi:hypothetical protein
MLRRFVSAALGLIVMLWAGEIRGAELPVVTPRWTGADLGRVGLAGSFAERGGVFTIHGAGGGLFVAGDGCYFVSSPMQRDFDVTVRAVGLKNSVANSTLRLLARESLEFDARDAYLFLRPNRDYIAASQARLIDGKLDDDAWKSAGFGFPFKPLLAWKQQGHQATQASVTYDDDSLYVAFRCAEDRPATMCAETTSPDDYFLVNDDHVQVLIASPKDLTNSSIGSCSTVSTC